MLFYSRGDVFCIVVWYGLLFVRGGLYKGAIFKFTLLIPANYPDGGCPVRQVNSLHIKVAAIDPFLSISSCHGFPTGKLFSLFQAA